MLLALLAFNHYDGNRYLRTQKQVIATWQAQDPSADSALVYWAAAASSPPSSIPKAARTTLDPQQLRAWLAGKPGSFIVSDTGDLERLPADIRARFAERARFNIMGDTMLLLADTRRLRRSRANEMSDAFVPPTC